jgi:hypothetical protein
LAIQVGIEQVDWDHVARTAFEVIAPGPYRHRAVFDRYGHTSGFFGAKIRRIPGLHFLGLDPRAIKVLLEVSLAVQKGEGNEGNAEIGCGTKRISSQNPQTS